ncbi:T9SS type A sorting domain-containing protein [Reichenbachiella sp.]|uniref:T9SS type A sorting domain-containing protein n=1 Tax=Reichenbachiella sp. TaxID=2184521 RepID=UPI003BAEAD04
MTAFLKKVTVHCFLICPFFVYSQNIYVDDVLGNDSNDGLSPGAGNAKATVAAGVATITAGNFLFIEDNGNDYAETVNVNKAIDLVGAGGVVTIDRIMLNADLAGILNVEGKIIDVTTSGVLQEGIDLVETSGQVNVASGSYSEALVVDKNLTIIPTGTPSTSSVQVTGGSTLAINGDFLLDGTGDLVTYSGSSIINVGSGALLFGNNANDPYNQESDANYITGTATMQARAVGTGSFSFLGINNSGGNDLGNVTLSRTLGSAGRIVGAVSMDESIDCSWDLSSDNTPSGQILTVRWRAIWDNSIANQAIFNDSGSDWTELTDPTDDATDPRLLTFTGVNAFGGFTVAATGDELPVELTFFKASQALDHTLLQWQTASEINHDYFEIQRSSDGENFEALDRLSSHHNSSSTHDYQWKDYQPLTGKSYYRLKMVDFDGYTEYSPIVSATSSQSLVLHPNPTSRFLNIQSDFVTNTVAVYSTGGKSWSLTVENQQIDVSSLLPGMYMMRMVSNAEVIQARFIKE